MEGWAEQISNFFLGVWHLQQAQHDERHHAQTDSQDDGHVAGFESVVVGHVRFGDVCDRLERDVQF